MYRGLSLMSPLLSRLLLMTLVICAATMNTTAADSVGDDGEWLLALFRQFKDSWMPRCEAGWNESLDPSTVCQRATRGNRWTNCTPSLPFSCGPGNFSFMYGVFCDTSGRVSAVSLNGCIGTSPPAAATGSTSLISKGGAMSHLTFLDLSDSGLGSASFVCNFTNLTALYLTNASLAGPIPGCFFSALTNLTTMQLSKNPSLSGTLPSSIASLSSLEQLSISECSLTGTIPAALSSLLKLQLLDLSSNRMLAGTVPSLASLSNLTTLNLCCNQFNQSIPSLSSLRLTGLMLNDNAFDGTLSASWSWTIPAMARVNVANNRLSGSIPADLVWNSLVAFDISGNQITGTLPESWRLQTIRKFDVSWNRLSGTLPSSWGFMGFQNLTSLQLHHNAFSGALPRSWWNVTPSAPRISVDATFNCLSLHHQQSLAAMAGPLWRSALVYPQRPDCNTSRSITLSATAARLPRSWFFAIVNASASHVNLSQCRTLCWSRNPRAYVAVATSRAEEDALVSAARAVGYNNDTSTDKLALGAVRRESGAFVWVEGPWGKAHGGFGTPFWQTNASANFKGGYQLNDMFHDWRDGEPNNRRKCNTDGCEEDHLTLYKLQWNDNADGQNSGCVCRVDFFAEFSASTTLSLSRSTSRSKFTACTLSEASTLQIAVSTWSHTRRSSVTVSTTFRPESAAKQPIELNPQAAAAAAVSVVALCVVTGGASMVSSDAVTLAALQTTIQSCLALRQDRGHNTEDSFHVMQLLLSPFAFLRPQTIAAAVGNACLVALIMALVAVGQRVPAAARVAHRAAKHSPNAWLMPMVIWLPGALRGAVGAGFEAAAGGQQPYDDAVPWWLVVMAALLIIALLVRGGVVWRRGVLVAKGRGRFDSGRSAVELWLRSHGVPRLMQPTGVWRPAWLRRRFGTVVAASDGQRVRWAPAALFVHSTIAAGVSAAGRSLPGCYAVLVVLVVLLVLLTAVLVCYLPYRVRPQNVLSIAIAILNVISAAVGLMFLLLGEDGCPACTTVLTITSVVTSVLLMLKSALSVALSVLTWMLVGPNDSAAAVDGLLQLDRSISDEMVRQRSHQRPEKNRGVLATPLKVSRQQLHTRVQDNEILFELVALACTFPPPQ